MACAAEGWSKGVRRRIQGSVVEVIGERAASLRSGVISRSKTMNVFLHHRCSRCDRCGCELSRTAFLKDFSASEAPVRRHIVEGRRLRAKVKSFPNLRTRVRPAA